MERLDGASTLPIKTETDLQREKILQMLEDSLITEDQAREMMLALGYQGVDAEAVLTAAGWDPKAAADIVGGVIRREGGVADWMSRTNNPAGLAFQQQAAREASIHNRQLDEFDRNLGIAMGQIDPEAEASQMELAPPEEQDQYWYLSEAQRGAKVGAPWGGGTPFKNDYARDRYYERPPIDIKAEAEMRERGVPEADIRRGRMSQQDIDMMEPGIGSDQGWAMVYAPGHDGRAVPRQRAPAGSGMDENTAMPNPDGNVDLITGGFRVGDRVDNRDLRPDLRNESLERQGYVPTLIRGPNGLEWVYELSDRRKANNYAYTQDLMRRQSMQRLRDQVPGAPADATADQLRSLISENRAADLAERTRAYRLSRMNPRMRAEMGLQQLDDPNLNEWQRLVLAQNLAPKVDGTTPLAADAFMNEQMLRAMQAQMTGRGFTGGAEVALGLKTLEEQSLQRQQARMDGLRRVGTRARDHLITFADMGGWDRQEQTRAALEREGATPEEADQIMSELFPPEAEEAPPRTRRARSPSSESASTAVEPAIPGRRDVPGHAWSRPSGGAPPPRRTGEVRW